MRKPIRTESRFLRFLAKPLLIIMLLASASWQLLAQPTLVVNDCQCLSNQSAPGNGQFLADLSITGATPGDTWYIASNEIAGLYSTTSQAPPSNPIPFPAGPLGFTLTEFPAGSGSFVMQGLHVDGKGFSIRLTNGGLDTLEYILAPGACAYPKTKIIGDDFVCENQFSGYSTVHNFGSAYSWNLGSGGNVVGLTSGTSIDISWNEDDPGPHLLQVSELAGNGCLVTAYMNVIIEDTIPLACNNLVNVSLNADCEGELTADMFLEDPQYEDDSYTIILATLAGQPIPGNTITSDYIGQQIMVTVIHDCSSNSCWSLMKVEDKIDPTMNCTVDTVRCDESFDPEDIGFPVEYLTYPVKTGPHTYTVQGPDLCGPLSLSYQDDTILNSCLDEFASFIVRRWDATDGAGNTSVCYDTIKTTRTGVADLNFPANWDGLPGHNPFLKSCGPWPQLPNGYPDPSYTGYPDGPHCGNITIDYKDIRLNICGEKSFKVIRKWFVMDMCSNEVFDTNQIIAIMDNDPPVVTITVDVEVSTDSYECAADVNLPLPTVLYECNSWTYTVGYKLADEFGNPPLPSDPYLNDSRVRKNADGTYTLLDLPLGQTWVKYTITDACDNSTESFFEVKVVDKLPPVAVCDQHTVVSLNQNGVGYAIAKTFDDGSWDNCGEVTFKARRFDNECGVPSGEYLDGLEFCCADIGQEVMVELLVTDEGGYSSSCMAFVEVQDKRFPEIVCPPEITVSCEFFTGDYSVFGTVVTDPALAKPIVITDPANPNTGSNHKWGYDGVATDNCDVSVEIVTEYETIDKCGVGTIYRTFRATDGQGNSTECTQVIHVVDFDPFYINKNNPNDTRDDVKWPKDYVLHGCLNGDTSPESLPNGFNEPEIYDDECSLVAYDYDDVVFQYVDGYCYKIVRTWTVIDWCQFDQTNPFGNGYWQYNQLIMVIDDELPEFQDGCQSTPLVNQLDDLCSAKVTLSASAIDDCTATEDLVWNYEIDVNTDGIVDYYGNKNTVTRTYPYGNHLITWYVEDECGNVNQCSRVFVVEDNKKPTPICYDGIVTVPMPTTGTVEIFAKSFNICNGCEAGSYDNCTPQDQLRFSFSSNVNDKSRVFSCDDIENGIMDTIDIEMWVTDLAGNQEFCNTHLILQDNQDICPDIAPTVYDVAGMVVTLDGSHFSNVDVVITSANQPGYPLTSVTNSNGVYSFNDLIANQNYWLTASSTEDPMGGISTLDLVFIQKHLLGLKLLDEPYKMIAADINGSGTLTAGDLLDLRKLILGVYEELPSNDAWRFVDQEAVFENPNNPFPFDEVREITPLRFHSVQNNFVAVKVGDVNNSLQMQGGIVLDERNSQYTIATANDISYTVGDQVTMDIYLKDILNLIGTQFTLHFEQNELVFEDLLNGQLALSSGNYSLDHKDNGYITLSWNTAVKTEIDPELPLFSVQFNALRSGNLSESVSLNSDITTAEVYFENDGSELTTNGLVLRYDDGVNGEKMVLYQNRPNPFSNETSIGFYLPSETDAVLSIYDLNGSLVFESRREKAIGYGEFIIKNDSKTFNTGLYYYKLQAGSEISTRKMIIIK